MRSWRYAMVVDDGVIENWFEEPGYCDNCESDPYGQTDPVNIIDFVRFPDREHQEAE
jgi:peroxiredoxin